MQVSVGLDLSLVFCGDTVQVSVSFCPKDEVHVLSATVGLQTTLHLGDLVEPEPFQSLKARGPIVGAHETTRRGLLGLFGLGAQKSNAFTLYRSQQHLLFAEKKLDTKQDFSAQFSIPKDICPSYRSKSLDVSHQVVVEFQIIKQARPAPCLVLLPFRVYPRPSTAYSLLGEAPHDALAARPATKRIKEHVASLLAGTREITPQPDEPLLAAGLPTKCRYELLKNKQHLATLHLARPFVSVGGVVVATLELSSSCYHLTATLEQSEIVKEGIAVANNTSTKLIAAQSSVVWGQRQTTLQLPIPAALVPQVEFDVVKTLFSLRLDLVCTEAKEITPQIATEVVSTSIPITIVAPSEGGSPALRTWTF